MTENLDEILKLLDTIPPKIRKFLYLNTELVAETTEKHIEYIRGATRDFGFPEYRIPSVIVAEEKRQPVLIARTGEQNKTRVRRTIDTLCEILRYPNALNNGQICKKVGSNSNEIPGILADLRALGLVENQRASRDPSILWYCLPDKKQAANGLIRRKEQLVETFEDSEYSTVLEFLAHRLY
jgi:hypothetical protein